MSAKKVCQFFRFGFCKYRLRCKLQHVKEVCHLEECSYENCQIRHPKRCFYFNKYGNCKLGSNCAYKHEKSRVESKLDAILKKNNEKDDLIRQLLNDVKELKAKVVELTNKNEQLVNRVDEINSWISEVEAPQVEDDDKEEKIGAAGYTDGQLIDLAVKYSKRSLNQLDTMKEDVLKCRKNDTLRKKFKSHSVSMEDDMYSHKFAMPHQITFVHNVLLDGFNNPPDDINKENNVKVEALKVIDKCIEQFNSFLKDPTKPSDW